MLGLKSQVEIGKCMYITERNIIILITLYHIGTIPWSNSYEMFDIKCL